jgi:SOS-response transcriptional repressor LexA
MTQISDNANRLLRFVHLHLELHRIAPTRQQMAAELGLADKKSILPLIGELELAGWVKARDGHRSDDWGGTYTRPSTPPFAHQYAPMPTNPQKGELVEVQRTLF